jgi:hypothetical protein
MWIADCKGYEKGEGCTTVLAGTVLGKVSLRLVHIIIIIIISY